MRKTILLSILFGATLFWACKPENARSTAIQQQDGPTETVVEGSTEGSPKVKGFGVEMTDPDLPEKLANMKPKAHNENPNIEIMGVNIKAPVDPVMVLNGKKVWDNRQCGSCHALDKSASSASSLHDVLQRRQAAFLMNMMYYPDPVKTVTGADREMIDRCGHREAGKLLTLIQARDLIEFFRANEGL